MSDETTKEPATETKPARGGHVVTRADLALAEFASDDAARWAMNQIRIDATLTQACNGHVLATVSGEREPANEWPTNDATAALKTDAVGITVDDAKAAAKALPKVRQVPMVDQKAIVGRNGDGIVIASTDVASWNVRRVREVEGEFPNVEKVAPQGEPIAVIGFSAEYLGQIAAYVQRFGSRVSEGRRCVKLEIFGADKAARLSAKLDDGREVTFILMPMRLD